MLPEFLQKHAAYNSGAPVHYKDFGFKPDEINGEGRTVDAYVTGYGNKDRAGDILIMGCCAKSIQERGPEAETPEIAYLQQHDMALPLGRSLKMEERERGLFTSSVHDDIQRANETLTQMRSGTLKYFSIGFNYVWDKLEYDQNLDAFIVKEIELFEYSVVTIASNNQTGIVAIKSSALNEQREAVRRETEMLLKKLNPKKQFELRQLIARHLSLATTQPLEFLREALKEVDKPTTKTIDWNKLGDLHLVLQ